MVSNNITRCLLSRKEENSTGLDTTRTHTTRPVSYEECLQKTVFVCWIWMRQHGVWKIDAYEVKM